MIRSWLTHCEFNNRLPTKPPIQRQTAPSIIIPAGTALEQQNMSAPTSGNFSAFKSAARNQCSKMLLDIIARCGSTLCCTSFGFFGLPLCISMHRYTVVVEAGFVFDRAMRAQYNPPAQYADELRAGPAPVQARLMEILNCWPRTMSLNSSPRSNLAHNSSCFLAGL